MKTLAGTVTSLICFNHLEVSFFFSDYDPENYNISNQFFTELIKFWAEFRNAVSDKDNKSSIMWNNKNIRIDGKPVFYLKKIL